MGNLIYKGGNANIFVAVETGKGKHMTRVTRRRAEKNFARFVKCVLDGLTTHFRSSPEKT
jgi:hypothetical protein